MSYLSFLAGRHATTKHCLAFHSHSAKLTLKTGFENVSERETINYQSERLLTFLVQIDACFQIIRLN